MPPPQRRGYGVARSSESGVWSGASTFGEREEITDGMLALFAQGSVNKLRGMLSRRAYSRVQWAYRGHHAYASCVDLITGCVLTNGEDPERRPWRLVPRRDERDEPIKNPDESQLPAVYRFLENCHSYLKFEQLLRPIMTDFVAANAVNVEIALSDHLVNPDGLPQPGALYVLPQAEIWPKVDDRGELDRLTPFVQLRPNSKPIPFTWRQSLWITDGYMRGPGPNPLTPVDSIITPVRTMIEAQRFVESYFTSGAKMGLTFKNDEWEKEDAVAFLQFVEENFLSTENGHRPFVLYGGVTMEDLPQNVHELAQFTEIMRAMGNTISSRFPVDPRLISAESQGSALGNKGERQIIWFEMLSGPVNRKKRAFSTAFTDQVIHKGLGATDWAFELVPFQNLEDAERMSQLASAYKTADESGFVNFQFPADLRTARANFDPELKELDDDEVLEFFSKPPPPPVQLPPPGGPVPALPPAPPAPDDKGEKPPEPPAPPENPPAKPPVVKGERAKPKVSKAAAPLVAAMDGWTAQITDELLTELLASVDKGIATLKPIYERSLPAAEGFTDANKKAFDEANVLPKSGALAADFRRALKGHYQVARKMAMSELKRGNKEIGSRATGKTPGGVDNWIESFGEHEFDDVYKAITKAMRKTFLTGLKSGWSGPEFVAQIKAKAPKLAEAQIDRVVRTASTEIFNIGRQNVAEESGDVVAYRYMAILEPDRTCELCEELDGLEIGIHDELADRFRPPNHPNCRCQYGFITKGEAWETDQSKVAKANELQSEEYGGKITGG